MNPGPAKGIPRGEWALLIVAAMAVGWFQLWLAQLSGVRANFGAPQEDYYNLLVEGFLRGQLHLNVTPPAALLQLANPYEPANRPPNIELHDASFFRGKYYLYYGVAPAVTLLLPFRALTGTALPLPVAVFVFAYVGFLASAALWLLVRRRYFPRAGTGLATLCMVMLGLLSLGPALVRRGRFYELPISSGYCFAMLALLCVYCSLHAQKRNAWWFCFAGTFVGLAVASRPTFLGATLALVVPLVWWWRNARARGRAQLSPDRAWWRLAAAGGIPLALIGVLVAAHNFLRFGQALEFGQTYLLGRFNYVTLPTFSAVYARFNAWIYGLGQAEWNRYFPFVGPLRVPAFRPEIYGDLENVYGLVNLPFTWLALGTLLILFRPEFSPLRMWLVAAWMMVATVTVTLLFFCGASVRYLGDFMPALVLLSCVGVLACDAAMHDVRSRVVRWLGRSAIVGVCLFSLGFAGVAYFRLPQALRIERPQTYERIARVFNYPTHWLERISGVRHGPIELTLKLPRVVKPGRQTLLVSGGSAIEERVFLDYLDAGHLRIGFVHGADEPRFSPPLAFEPGREHRVWVSLPSLFPPAEHPLFRGLDRTQTTAFTRGVRIAWDGDLVIHARENARAPLANRNVLVGRAAAQAAAGEDAFTGEIGSLRRDSVEGALRWERAEGVRLRVKFPTHGAATAEPLLASADAAPNGDLFFVEYAETGVRFGWRTGTQPPQRSAPIACDRGRIHLLEVRVGNLPSTKDATSDARRSFQVILDGAIVWSQSGDAPRDAPARWIAGENRGQVPECAAAFSGTIHQVEAFALDRDPLVLAQGAHELKVLLPPVDAKGRHPLIVTGEPGRADLLTVERVDPRRVRFVFDHWGFPSLASDLIEVDEARVHELGIRFGAFRGSGDRASGAAPAPDSLRVTLDRRLVWSRAVSFYVVDPTDVFFGLNPLGGTSSLDKFGGQILSVKPAARTAGGEGPR